MDKGEEAWSVSTGVLGDSGSSIHLQGPSRGASSGRLVWLDRLAAWGKGSQLTPPSP